jgi:RNA polymerase sigma-70 factor (ECF subfamily)
MDRPSAESLFESHHRAIFRFLSRQTGDRRLAEDLTQETFLRVVRGLERFEPRERDLAWLFRIARRLLSDRRRDDSRRPTLVPEAASQPSASGDTADLRLRLGEALTEVPEAEREAFLLREHGGLGYEEIAALTGVTPDAVRNRIHRARSALREAMSAELTVARHRLAEEPRS